MFTGWERRLVVSGLSILRKTDFQDYELWRSFNYGLLAYIAREYDGTIIVPMTITHPAYYQELVQTLINDGIPLKHYILYAEKDTIIKRLNKRWKWGETWAKSQIDRCIHAFNIDITEEKIMTDGKSIDQVVEEVAARSQLTLLPDNRSRLQKWVDRKLVLLRHVR